MVRRLASFLALATLAVLIIPDEASAFGRRCRASCSPCYYVDYCWPCYPCYPCYGWAYKDPYNHVGKVKVYFPCCPEPNYLARWYYCMVRNDNGQWHWGWALVYKIYWHRDGQYGEPADDAASVDNNRATLTVNLPADAKLTIDDHPTTSTSGTRVFTTPALEEGKTYSYTLRAEVVRDGQLRSVTREVTVRAAQETQVTFDERAAIAMTR